MPQLFTAYGGPHSLKPNAIENILARQMQIQSMIAGIHLWGKKRSKAGRIVSHAGDLTSYFEDDVKKDIFLNWLAHFLNDGRQRYFVPEVNNSDADLLSIVRDLESKGIQFC